MRTTFITRRLVMALIAVAVLSVLAASASAEEPYQRVTVEELKRIQKQNDEEQRRLEATPEYQEKKRQEAAARKQREEEAFVAKEREMQLRMQAAQVERTRVETQNLANQGSMSYSSSGGVVVAPTYYNAIPRLAVYAHPVHVAPYVGVIKPVVRPAVRIRR